MDLTPKGIALQSLKGEKPNFITTAKEMEVTQEMQTSNYDNYTVGDDHLMHIVGMSKGSRWKRLFHRQKFLGR